MGNILGAIQNNEAYNFIIPVGMFEVMQYYLCVSNRD
jgi:hypothetical protein